MKILNESPGSFCIPRRFGLTLGVKLQCDLKEMAFGLTSFGCHDQNTKPKPTTTIITSTAVVVQIDNTKIFFPYQSHHLPSPQLISNRFRTKRILTRYHDCHWFPSNNLLLSRGHKYLHLCSPRWSVQTRHDH